MLVVYARPNRFTTRAHGNGRVVLTHAVDGESPQSCSQPLEFTTAKARLRQLVTVCCQTSPKSFEGRDPVTELTHGANADDCMTNAGLLRKAESCQGMDQVVITRDRSGMRTEQGSVCA